jgi:hypothetical protein
MSDRRRQLQAEAARLREQIDRAMARAQLDSAQRLVWELRTIEKELNYDRPKYKHTTDPR